MQIFMYIVMLTLSRGGNYYDPVECMQRRYAVLLLYTVFVLDAEDGNKLWYLPARPMWQLTYLQLLSVLVYV